MTRWKELPAGLDPSAVEFVGELRRLKDVSGLSQRRLAARTGYSASSWERYLGGRLLPPGGAVEALAVAAGVDAVRLLARRDAVAELWRREADVSVPAEHRPEPPAPDGELTNPGSPVPSAAVDDVRDLGRAVVAGPGGWRFRLVLTAVVSAAVGATISGLVVGAETGSSSAVSPHAVASVHPVALVPSPIPYTCTYVRRGGLWYAGDSSTVTDNVVVDDSGPEVAELQCLLQRIHISPGGVDGDFGPLTSFAVIQAQKALHLDVDGQVGPNTWAALRR